MSGEPTEGLRDAGMVSDKKKNREHIYIREFSQ